MRIKIKCSKLCEYDSDLMDNNTSAVLITTGPHISCVKYWQSVAAQESRPSLGDGVES